jgi:hypothetical protein
MHHYRFQKVYIKSTASELIVDILEFFLENSPMPQLSSADRLIMAANDIADALKHLHLDFTFNTVGYDTISALTTLSPFSKESTTKFQRNTSLTSQLRPQKTNALQY